VTALQAALEAAARLIGPCEITETLGPAVARISARSGEEYVVKKHADRDKHAREVHAYQHWIPALGSSAPQLVAADAQALTIVATALDGRPCSGPLTAAAHHRAGTILRRFHDAEPPRLLPGYRDWLRDRIAYWTARARPFIKAADLDSASAHLAVLQQGADPDGVPCHLDFQPRNWLLGPDADVYLVDFEHARADLPLRDLVRLRFRAWPGRPDLKDAFLTGYGRDLTRPDAETLQHLGALDALTAVARGHQNHDVQLVQYGHSTLRQLRATG
jgi:Ser/Thr protein kinase RdoA (MazF antagonist)